MRIVRFKRYIRQLTRITYLPFFIILFASFFLIFLFTYQDDFFKQDFAKGFERTYGWAWLMKLYSELISWENDKANG